jgi:hypothetical protein
MRNVHVTRRWAAAALLAACLALRAGQEGEKTNTLRFEDLPDPAKRALALQSDGGVVGGITKSPDTFVLEFTLEGKSQEFLVRDDLKSEGPRPAGAEGSGGTEIQWTDLPQAVQELASSKFAGVSLGKIQRRPGVYRARIDRGGEAGIVRFTERGRILSETNEKEALKREAEGRELELHRQAEEEHSEQELKAKRDAEATERERLEARARK